MFNTVFKTAKFSRNKRFNVTFISALVAILFAHLFGILTILKKGDNFLFYGYNDDITSGRWGLKILSKINEIFFHIYNLNYLNSIISLILISIAAYYIILLFDIKNLILCSIWTVIFIVFPTVTSTIMYSFTILPYSISLLSAIYATYSIETYKRGYIISIILLWFSLGIYQAYLTMVLSIFSLQILKNLLNNKYSFNQLFLKSLSYIFVIFVAIILYIITTKLFIEIYNVQLTSYQDINNMGKISIFQIPQILSQIYLTFIGILVTNNYSLFDIPPVAQTLMLKISIISLLVLSIYLVIKILKVNKINKKNIFFTILILLIFPISLNGILIMTRNGYVHALMIYSQVFIFLLPIILIDLYYNYNIDIKSNILKKIGVIFLSIVIIQYTYLSNLNYNVLYYSTQKSINYINRLTTKITEIKGFNTKLKWAFIGNVDDELFKNSYMKDIKTYMLRMNGFTFNLANIRNPEAFSQYIGYDPIWLSISEINDIKNIKEIKNMPIYPNDGSIKIYKDIIIVKLSNE